jgi:hypothetical protein
MIGLPYLAAGAAVAVGLAYVGGQWRGRSVEHEARLQEVAAIKAKINAERDVWTDMIINLGSDLTQDANTIDTKLRTDLAAARGDLASARERLRKRSASSPATAKPADTAPSECRAFEAAPDLLPVRDRDLLLRLGDAANRVVLERNACVARYESARKTVNESAEKEKERAEAG